MEFRASTHHHCMEPELVDTATLDGSFQVVDCGNDQVLEEWISFSSCRLVQHMHQTNPSMENLKRLNKVISLSCLPYHHNPI